MRLSFRLLAAVPLLIPTSCVVESVAKTAVDVVTVPVKVVGAGVDAVVPNQRKADEKRGRALRREDEQRSRVMRETIARCRSGRPLPTDDCAFGQPR